MRAARWRRLRDYGRVSGEGVWARRGGRWWVIVGLGAVIVGAAGGLVAWWWLPDSVRLGWTEVERASWVAAIIAALVAVAGGVVGLVVRLRQRAEVARWSRWPRRVRVVGRIPQLAAWYQPREAAVAVAAAAAGGRTTVRTQVLSGTGGVGKTQVAARFARQLAEQRKLDLLVWVNAANVDAIISGYADAATVLDLAEVDSDAPQSAARLLRWLEDTNRRWLVVLDDLTQPSDLSGWWPGTSPRGRVLITTRRRDAVLHTEGRAVVDVDLFTPGEARAYLGQALDSNQPPCEIDQLAVHLGHLPLALTQAAAYIRDRNLTCGQYRTRLADRRRKLRELLPEEQALPDAQQATVAATWSLSIEAADALNPEGLARPVLDLASVLDPNGIPTAVFTGPAALAYLATAAGRQATGDDATDALHNLHRLNLLTVDHGQHGRVQVHALVQRATRDAFTDHQAGQVSRAAADALLQLWPDPERDPAASAILRANTTALHEHTGDTLLTPEVHTVLFRAGDSLGYTGQLTVAQDHFQRLLDQVLPVLGPDHPDTLATRHDLACWRGGAGDVAGAIEALQAVLADRLRVLGPDHPDTLRTRSNLAWLRGEAGDVAGAVEALEALLPDMLRVLGPDHPHALRTRHNLVSLRGEAGNAAGGIEAYEALLVDRLRVQGADHPDTLATRSSLASWRGQAGDVAGAIEAYEALLAGMLRVLGADHPYTLRTRHSLASLRGQAGDVAGAIEAYEALLVDRLRVLGADHPDTLTTRHSLASWRGRAEDAAGAVEAYEALQADQLRVLGADHPDTLHTRSSLASWRGQAGDVAGAVEALEALVPDMLRVLGADHPDTLHTRSSLASWRGQAGDVAGAVEAYEALLVDRLRVLGADHPDTLTTRHSLASLRGRAGEVAGAVEAYEALLVDRLRVLGADHPDTLRTRSNLAWLRGEAGDVTGAVEAYEALLVDRLRALGADHPDTLHTRSNLAHWWAKADVSPSPHNSAANSGKVPGVDQGTDGGGHMRA